MTAVQSVPRKPNATTVPKLAVVLVTRSSFQTIRRTVQALRGQTIADEIELIIVATTREAVNDSDPGELEGFARVEIVAAGFMRCADKAAPKGMRRATAPVVAWVEDHVFPEANWAEEIVKVHEGPWAVVNGHMINANPETALSWANIFLSHRAELVPRPGESKEVFTSHNASYKKAVLDTYGDDLEHYMGHGGDLQRDLLDKGHRLYIHLDARYYHLQMSSWRPIAPYRFALGRHFAAARVRQNRWGWGRRGAYIVAGPLIPLVQLSRLIKCVRQFGQFPRVLPPLLLGLVMEALGEMVGYAVGEGDAIDRMAQYEENRPRHMSRGDRLTYEATADKAVPHLA